MKQLCDGNRPRGRQRKLTPEVAELIIERLANGELLRAICRDLDIAPSIVYQYKLDNKEFDDSFTRARDFADELMEEDAIEIIDEESPTEDTEIEYAADGKPIGGKRRRSDNVARSKARAEIRLKIVARRKGGLMNRKIQIEADDKREDLSDVMKGMSMDDLMRFAGLDNETDGK